MKGKIASTRLPGSISVGANIMDLDFPSVVSLTVTNACNLRCRMCGQWSEEGYIRGKRGFQGRPLGAEEWKKLVDEVAGHRIEWLLVRGGEPFLLPGIMDLLEHIVAKGIPLSIDSNGTRLAEFAEDLVRLGKLHVTVSVDGDEQVHDGVRGVPGCFEKIKRGLARLSELDPGPNRRVSRSLCFTISPWSLPSLGDMPTVARRLGVDAINIVPYFYVPSSAGETWRREIRELLGREAFSWRGFHHEGSGVDSSDFAAQYQRYKETLGELKDYPYLPLTLEEFRTWFADGLSPVGRDACYNVEALIDVQPTGEANFCVDFPDGALGNVRQESITAIWNGERARRFRERRRQGRMGACHRCGARLIAAKRDRDGWPIEERPRELTG
jgi:MoaA/NifB/PqqE/SkfB family radical SAM enzyme